MKKVDISRRTLLAVLLKSTAAALSAPYWVSASLAEPVLRLNLPEAGSVQKPSFSVFLALSQLVTLRTSLDERVAQCIYSLFLDEPWGAYHIHSTYTQLLTLLGKADARESIPSIMAKGELGKGQAWFASHLLTTWYLGIYYHERIPPVRVAYAEALMFDAVSPELPLRYVEATGFGAWGNQVAVRSRP